MPSPPKVPGGLPSGLRFPRWAAGGILGLAGALLLEEVLLPWYYTTIQGAFLGGWKEDFRCKDGNPQWINGNFTFCVNRQQGLAPFRSPAEYLAATPGATHMNMLRGPYLFLGSTVWDLAVNYSKVVPSPAVVPEVHTVPWPEHWPLPNPDLWPVGLPYPVVAPRIGQAPGSMHSSRGHSVPAAAGAVSPARAGNPRPPGRGVKERKVRGSRGVLAALNRAVGMGLAAYSEFGDLVDALHDALPKKYRAKGHVGDKLSALYEHWDKVDMAEAVDNIIRNEVEDRLLGKGFGSAAKTLGHSSTAGPRALPGLTY